MCSSDLYYILLNGLNDLIPLYVQEKVRRMVNNDFLSSYDKFEYIPQTFGYISRRAKFEHQFDQALKTFNAIYPELNHQFLIVFPMMRNKVIDFGINLQN